MISAVMPDSVGETVAQAIAPDVTAVPPRVAQVQSEIPHQLAAAIVAQNTAIAPASQPDVQFPAQSAPQTPPSPTEDVADRQPSPEPALGALSSSAPGPSPVIRQQTPEPAIPTITRDVAEASDAPMAAALLIAITPDFSPREVSGQPAPPGPAANLKPRTTKSDQPATPSAHSSSLYMATPRLPSPVETLPQISMPADDTNEPSDTGSSPTNAPSPVNSASTPPQAAAEIAFGARIVEKDAAEPIETDSFSRSVPQKTPDLAREGPASTPNPVPAASRDDDAAEKITEKAPLPAAAPHADAAKTTEASILPEQPAARNSSRPEPAADTVAPRAVPLPESSPRSTQPVHDITLRLSSENQQVDVKLVDRGGELHVAVQSADPVLTTDLRASVHDLISGLEKNGLRAETWPPQPDQSASGGDQRRQGRDNQNPNNAPDDAPPKRHRGSIDEWMKEVDALLRAGKEV
jgi:hypothetical protein